ncbi:MAG: hypothetical protein LBT39_00620, partial [Treponema sp.]|nr:hypothetical protein [Treponema sp.]
MIPRRRLFVPVLLLTAFAAFSQSTATGGNALGVPPGLGVSTLAAERYLLLAEQLIGDGRWEEALETLERGGDFADVSSDISYLLARARYHGNFPLRSVLEALRRAFGADRWTSYSPSQARLLEAEILIGLRSFSEALQVLVLAEQSPGPGIEADNEVAANAAMLRLLALKNLPDLVEFRRFLEITMDRYPRDPRPLEILFSWARDRLPDDKIRSSGNPGTPVDRALIDR